MRHSGERNMARKNRFTRRDFIRTTAGAAGAAAVAQRVMLKPQPIAAQPGSAAPSDSLRFGMIGIGMQGNSLLGTSIQLPGVECVAACDLYDGRHELAKEIVGKPIPTTRHYQELLDNKDID